MKSFTKKISNKGSEFIDIPIDVETLESIARVEGCHYLNFDWWEVSQYIKNLCLNYEKSISNCNFKKP